MDNEERWPELIIMRKQGQRKSRGECVRKVMFLVAKVEYPSLRVDFM